MLVLPLLRADVVSVTDRASIRAGGTRDVTEPINSWGWRGTLQSCHFQPPSPGKALLSSEQQGLACGQRGWIAAGSGFLFKMQEFKPVSCFMALLNFYTVCV